MPKFSRLLHCSLNLRKLFIHRVPFLNISTYLPIWDRLATGSILAIIFGILLAFSLIATGYLFFSRRRARPAKNIEKATPFQNVEYDYLGPTPHTSMQSSSFGPRAADTKTINSEVINSNVSHPLVSKMLQRSLTVFVLFSPLYVVPIHFLPPG
jgi:hypothetical protein